MFKIKKPENGNNVEMYFRYQLNDTEYFEQIVIVRYVQKMKFFLCNVFASFNGNSNELFR